MPDTITARDANHQFSRVLREVAAGKEFVVTRNGQPIARIIPEPNLDGVRHLTPEQEQALDRSLVMLRQGWRLGIARVDRAALHDDVRTGT
jgi:prevent-host-death family protein